MSPTSMSDKLENWFSYHPPESPEDVGRYERVRAASLAFAREIVANTPPSADQTSALRHVRDAVATANMTIACKGQ